MKKLILLNKLDHKSTSFFLYLLSISACKNGNKFVDSSGKGGHSLVSILSITSYI